MDMSIIRYSHDHGAGVGVARGTGIAAEGRGDGSFFFANALLLATLVGGCLNLMFVHIVALDERYAAYVYSLVDALNWQLVVYPIALGLLVPVTIIGWVLRWDQRWPPKRRIATLLGQAVVLGVPLGTWLNLWLVELSLRAPLERYPGYTPQGYPLLYELASYRMYALAALGAATGMWLVWRGLQAIVTRIR